MEEELDSVEWARSNNESITFRVIPMAEGWHEDWVRHPDGHITIERWRRVKPQDLLKAFA